MKTISTLELKEKISQFSTLKANNKSLNDLTKTYPEYKESSLCNSFRNTSLKGNVNLIWDDINNCPGLFFEQHESFLNLVEDIQGNILEEDQWRDYYQSEEGFSLLVKAYEFFTK